MASSTFWRLTRIRFLSALGGSSLTTRAGFTPTLLADSRACPRRPRSAPPAFFFPISRFGASRPPSSALSPSADETDLGFGINCSRTLAAVGSSSALLCDATVMPKRLSCGIRSRFSIPSFRANSYTLMSDDPDPADAKAIPPFSTPPLLTPLWLPPAPAPRRTAVEPALLPLPVAPLPPRLARL